jgi:hypothetical protein
MRRIAAVVLLLAGILAGATVSAQIWKPRPGLTVWADADFNGLNTTFTADTPDISASGLGRAISSVRVGPKESWQICTEPNYGGRCRTVTGTIENLQSVGFNDSIMSVRKTPPPPTPAPAAAPAPSAPAAAPAPVVLAPATGLELYAGTGYSGRKQILRESTENFRSIDFSDRAMSLRVPRNETWEICINIDFDECRLVSEDIPDLAAIGISRMISSARPHYTRGRGGRARIVYYDGVNFRGRSVTIDDDRPSFGNSNTAVGSVRVVDGEWQICDRPRFFGNCVVIDDDVRDLSRLGLRGPVASVRRNQER